MLSVYMGNFIAIPHGTDEAKYVKNPASVSFKYQMVILVPKKKKDCDCLFGIAGVGDEHLQLVQQIAFIAVIWTMLSS